MYINIYFFKIKFINCKRMLKLNKEFYFSIRQKLKGDVFTLPKNGS